MSTTRKLVIAEAYRREDGGYFYIVEVNEHDDDTGDHVAQHSRTPFEFSKQVPEAERFQIMRDAMAAYFVPAAPEERPLTVLHKVVGTEL